MKTLSQGFQTLILLFLTFCFLNARSQVASQDEFKKESKKRMIAKAKDYEQRNAEAMSQVVLNKKAGGYTPPPDTDADGMPDSWETANGLNMNDPKDAWADGDADGVINLFEYQLNSNPKLVTSPTVVKVTSGANLETALDNAKNGQLIRVQAGTYLLNYSEFTSKSIMIQGGWNSTFTARDPWNTPTILDGDNKDEVMYFSYSDDPANVVIDGLTLTRGQGSFGALGFISSDKAVANLCIRDCNIIDSKSTSSSGGVLYINHWDSSYSEVIIANTLIAGDSTIGIKNQSTEAGVGNWKILNSTITRNSKYGIEAFTLDDGKLSIAIRNSIFWGNQIKDIFVRRSISIDSKNSDIRGDSTSAGATHNKGAGVINADPLFVDPSALNYKLKSGSPCINTGIDIGLPFAGSAPDMGAFETGLSGIKEYTGMQGIKIFPNPATEWINMSLPQTGSKVSIYDTKGALVFEQNCIGMFNTFPIQLLNGIYLLKVEMEGNIHSQRISVQR